MLGSFNSSRTVIIGQTKRFCRGRQFNSEFPPQLTGIIHPQEFYQSIDNINQAWKRTFGEKIIYSIFWLCVLLGFIIFIVGGASTALPTRAVFIALLATGGGISIASFCIGIVIMAWINLSRRRRLTEAINAESMKYSTKLPIPTKWRLNVYTYTTPGESSPNVHEVYSIIIDIGKRADSGIRSDGLSLNRNLHEPTSYIGQQHPGFPLSYQNLSVTNSHNKSLFNQQQAHIHSPV